MKPLGEKEPLGDFMKRVRRHRSEAHEKVRAQLAQKGSFVVMLIPPSANYHGLWKTITRSTRPGVNWQVTSWAGNPHGAGANPIGHVDITGGAEEAAREIESGAIAPHEAGQNPSVKKGKAASLARERGWINAQKLIGNVSSASRDQKPIKESVLRHDGKSYLLSAYLMRSGVWWLLRTQPAPGKLVGAGMASTDEGETLNMGHSALLPEYRGKGLYQAVLRAFLGLYAGVCSDMTKTMTGASKRSWEQLGGKLRVSSKKVKPFFGMSPEMFEKIAPGGKIATERYCLPGARVHASPERATKHESGQNPRVNAGNVGRSEKQTMTMTKTTTATISALNDARACAKINAIRLRAGNPGTHCPSCGHSAYAPYSRSIGGKRVEGCIDAFHHGHTPPGYSEWYGRQTARELRRETLRMLERLGGGSARSARAKAGGERAAKHERGQNPTVKIADMKVLRSFLNKQEAEGKKLSTDGRSLDGNWLGGSNIAEWKSDKMHLHDTGSRAGQAWQKKIQAALPDAFFTEDWMRPAGWKRRQAERAHSAAHASVERHAGRTEVGLRRQDYRTAPELKARIDALVGRKK